MTPSPSSSKKEFLQAFGENKKTRHREKEAKQGTFQIFTPLSLPCQSGRDISTKRCRSVDFNFGGEIARLLSPFSMTIFGVIMCHRRKHSRSRSLRLMGEDSMKGLAGLSSREYPFISNIAWCPFCSYVYCVIFFYLPVLSNLLYFLFFFSNPCSVMIIHMDLSSHRK